MCSRMRGRTGEGEQCVTFLPSFPAFINFFISQWGDERERERFTYVKCNFSIKRHLNLPRQDEIRRMKMVRGDSKDAFNVSHSV